MKLILKILIVLFFLIPSLSWAAVNLPWLTTYNCTEWNQDDGNPTCVDSGIQKYGGWYACPSGMATGGNAEKTTLIDTTVNFVTSGIIVGDYVRNHDLNQVAEITSITTTTNDNDTLSFSAMAAQNVSGNTYFIYDNSISTPPTLYDHTLAKREQITTEANHSSGGGSKGQRHWLGDGVNVNSGGTAVEFTTGQTEIWIRWYMRFQTGFKWSGYQGFKIIYPHGPASVILGTDSQYYVCIQNHTSDASNRPITGENWTLYWSIGGSAGATWGSGLPYTTSWGNYFMVAYQSDRFNYYTQYGDTTHYAETTAGWSQTFCGGGTESDGLWHSIELHVKSETGAAPNNTDGIIEWWIDGVGPKRPTGWNTVDHGLNSLGHTIGWVLIGSNAKYPDNGMAAYYVDYDDIAVSNTGYIGPLGSLTLGSGGSISLGSGGSITLK